MVDPTKARHTGTKPDITRFLDFTPGVGLHGAKTVLNLSEMDKGVDLERFRELKAQAKNMATVLPVLFTLGNGYYWDYEKKRVIPGDGMIMGEKPDPPRDERRAIQRECRKIRKEEKAKQKRLWGSMEDSLPELVRNCGQAPEKQAAEPAGMVETEEVAVTADMALQEKIEEIFTALGPNGILRFLHWTIEMIAEDMSTDPVLREKYLEPHAFTRERDITLSELLTFLLTMSGENMNTEVYEYFKMTRSHPSTAAVVARRSKLKAEGMDYFFRRITDVCQCICRSLPDQYVSLASDMGFASVFAADGSGISVFLNEANEDTFVRAAEGQKGSNQYHLNAIRDHVSGLFISAVLQPITRLNETSATVQMIRAMVTEEQSIFMGDRGYGSLNLIHTLNLKEKMDFVIRIKESWIKETRDMPLAPVDETITIHVITTQRKEDKERVARGEAKYLSGISRYGKNKESKTWDYESEVDVTFRVVRFQLENGTWETLVTNLPRERFSPECLKELYHLRWKNIENAFRVLKWDNHLAQMHCKKDNSARQEVFARLAMYNIVSCVIKVAESLEPVLREIKNLKLADSQTKSREEDTEHPMVINRRFATHLVCDFLRNMDSITFDVIEMMLRYKCPVREGRSFRRDMRNIGFASFFYR